MLESLLVCLHGPVHHRRGCAQTGPMRVSHHVEPLVSARFSVTVQQLAHAIDENLRASARNAVEARRDQALDDRWYGQLRQAREVNDFWRRERVELESGIPLLDRAKQ